MGSLGGGGALVLVLLLGVLLGAGTPAPAGPAEPAGPVTAESGGALRADAVPAAYAPLVQQAARSCPAVPGPVLAAQLHAESGWNPRAVSPVGARGLAQFMPGTWAGEGVDGDGDGRRDPFTPADAVAAQAAFMCKLLAAVRASELPGDPLDLTLAAYNAGLGAVQRYRGIPPYAETQGYVRRIRALTATYVAPASAVTTAPAQPGTGPVGGWVVPIAAPLTSRFGQRWGRLHAGIDFGAPIGTPVHAAHAGRVLAAGPASGYGQWVKLEHPGGVTTVYGHISRTTVTVGQAVQAGQVIALSGNEGRSTGPHLHFETRVASSPSDPVTFYAARGSTLASSRAAR